VRTFGWRSTLAAALGSLLLASCQGPSAELGDIPDVGGASGNIQLSAPSLCGFAGRFDAIVVGRVTRTEINTAPWMVFEAGTQRIADECSLPIRENFGIEIEIAVERVLLGTDPGASVTARLGSDAALELRPVPQNVDGKLAWLGVDEPRPDGSPYGEPLVSGQQVGLTLFHLSDPASPVEWTVAAGRFFMEKTGGLAFSQSSNPLPSEATTFSTIDDLSDAIASCGSGQHPDFDPDLYPLNNYAGRCYGPDAPPHEPSP